MLPWWNMHHACSWFGLVVYIERMTHSSSATVARLGSNSLISMPDLPCLANSNPLGNNPAVVRSVRRSAVAGRCPAYFINAGFGSHRSTCEGPPVMKSRMTFFAFGGKCGPTERASAANASPARRSTRPSMPTPPHMARSASRRENLNLDLNLFRAKRSPRWSKAEPAHSVPHRLCPDIQRPRRTSSAVAFREKTRRYSC